MSTMIYHAGGIGDFITTLPAIQLWNKYHPGQTRLFFGRLHCGILAQDSGYIDRVLDIDSSRSCKQFSPGYPGQVDSLFPGLSSALLFTGTDSPFVENLVRHGGIQVICLPPFPQKSTSKYSFHYESLCTAFNEIASFANRSFLKPSKPNIRKALNLMDGHGSTIALHAGSGSALKNWPLVRFMNIAEDLSAKGYSVFFIAGPDDPFPELESAHVIFNESLPFLAAFLSLCTLFIGNDSGIAHLAAAAGCPSLVIF
ncbi:MAG: hypothetical protein GF350_09460, partial [Chitinivibrionales bacterium]|nr:hypothetical protein [Chitinivibrionales bacterium]